MKKITLVVLVICLMFSSVVYASIPYEPNPDTSKVKFIDVPDKHWAKSAIYKLAAQSTKIIGGYPDGTFKPDSNMTRAEFVTALIRTMGYQTSYDVVASYKDVPLKHWANKYIGIAQQRGIIDATDYGESFKPEEIITRFEACRMLINSFSRTKLVVNDSSVTMYPVFKDALKLDQKNKKIVHILYKKDILQGYIDNTAGLNKYATRAELAAFILRFMDNSEKLENYIVTAEDTAALKPFIDGFGYYATYRILLPDYTRTARGWAERNPELTERINYIEWEHVGKNYNGKYKNFLTQLEKRMKPYNNPYNIDYNKCNIVALNVTVSYKGKIEGFWSYDYEKLLRNAYFSDNTFGHIELKCIITLEDINAWANGKLCPLSRFTDSSRIKTYTLYAIADNLPSTGFVRLNGGRSTAYATDERIISIAY